MSNTRTIRLPSISAVPRGTQAMPPLGPPPPPPPQGPPPRRSFFGVGPQVRVGPTSAHPQMAAMYWACADLLGMVSDLAAARGALPPATELRSTIEQQLSKMMERARGSGIVTEDIVDAQYALVALIDEFLARVHGWRGQAEWRQKPLQLVYFNENTAGENFFHRVAVLEGQPHRAHVLQVYFLCMAVGFQGRYAVAGGEGLGPIYDRVGARVSEASGPDVLSPHGEPRDNRGLLQREAPLVRVGLGVLGFALLLFLAMRIILSVQVRDASKPLQDFSNASTSSTHATGGKR